MALLEEMEEQGNTLFKYRGQIPIILILTGMAVFAFEMVQLKQGLQPPKDYMFLVALAVSLFGLVLRFFTVGFTPKNTSGRNTEAQVADVVNTKGMYSLFRHPLYVGNFFMSLGIALLTMNFWFVVIFIMFYWIFYERVIFAEEQFLRKKFGSAYTDWAGSTNIIFPTFKNWESAELDFSWKKIIKKEKNGILSMFLLIMLFDCLGGFILTGDPITEKVWPIACTTAAAIYYVIIKVISKTTNLLNLEAA